MVEQEEVGCMSVGTLAAGCSFPRLGHAALTEHSVSFKVSYMWNFSKGRFLLIHGFRVQNRILFLLRFSSLVSRLHPLSCARLCHGFLASLSTFLSSSDASCEP